MHSSEDPEQPKVDKYIKVVLRNQDAGQQDGGLGLREWGRGLSWWFSDQDFTFQCRGYKFDPWPGGS